MPLVSDALKAQIAPYLLAIKAAIAVAIFLFGMGFGCTWQRKHDAARVRDEQTRTAQANARTAQAVAQGQVLADQLDDVTARTRAQAEAAKAEAARAKAEARAAAEEVEATRRRIGKAEADLAKALRNTDCRKLLETKSCAAIR